MMQPSDPTDPRTILQAAAMSTPQKAAVAVTVALSALDGYDVLAATLAAPGLVAAWHISYAALGLVLSMGLAGMASGSLVLAPFADVIGRRRMVFVALACMGAGMGLSAISHSVAELSFWRFVTGLGIGAMVSIINPLATEFSNARHRDLAVSLMAIGYPVGGVIGGTTATLLLQHFEWPILFIIGCGLAVVMVPIVWRWLPEPLSFLIERPRPDSVNRVNSLMIRFALPPVSALPPPATTSARGRLAELFSKNGLPITLRVTVIDFLYMVSSYYALSWIPQLVADRGFSQGEAASVSLWANLAGIMGGIAFGWATTYFSIKSLGVVTLAGLAISSIVFGYMPADLAILRLGGALIGFSLFAGACALHAIVSRSFADHVRATGAGFVIGVGRIGSAVAPAIAGILFAYGFEREIVSVVMGSAVFVGAFLLIGLRTLTPSARIGTVVRAK